MKKELIKLSSRFLGAVIAVTAALVALTAFSGDGTILSKIMSYFVNANLAWVTALILAYAWKWEFTGGIAFLIAAFVYTIVLYASNPVGVVILVALPLTVTGILFITDGIIHMIKDDIYHSNDINPLTHH